MMDNKIFDEVIDRKNTDSLKVDFKQENSLPDSVLPLWVADMDFRAAPCIIEALQQSVDHGIFGYTDIKDDYYQAVSSWFSRRFSWNTQKQWLVVTPGVVYAVATAVRALTEKGDRVLIQTPVYYPFYNVIRDNGRELVENPLIYQDGQYHIDFADFEKKIADNQVKLFILCSPHNPVCRVWTADELKKMGEICHRYGVIVVSDEIHCDFTYSGHVHTIFPEAAPEMYEHCIICTAPSKSFNLAGLQVSNIWIPGEELREKFKAEVKGSGYSVPANLGIKACKAAYRDGEEWFEQCKKYIEENLNYVRAFIRENMPKIKLVEPEGTYFAWLDCSEMGLSAEELDDFIIGQAGLWLDSGKIFGKASEQFQRIVLASPKAIIETAMMKLKTAYDAHFKE